MLPMRIAIAIGLLVVTLCSNALAGNGDSVVAPKRFPWDVRPGKCFMSAEALASPPCQAPTEWGTLSQSVTNLATLWGYEDYDLIQRAEQDVGFSSEQFSSGEYKFEAWTIALESRFRWEPVYGRPVLERWKKAAGNGGYAQLAEAVLTIGEAWKARGDGYGNTVSPEGWDQYRWKLAEANKALDACSDKVKGMGPWHLFKLMVAYQDPKLRDQRWRLLRSASAAWPKFTRIYSVPMWFSGPRWGGSFEEVDSIARYAMDQTKGEIGAGMYAILYAGAFSTDGTYTLKDSAADWPLIKQGIRDLESKSGVVPIHWYELAKLACQMRDKPEAARVFGIIDALAKGAPSSAVDSCRQFAIAP